MAKVSTTTETITPSMAESWLEKNKDNRPMRDFHVRMLAKEMADGRWQLNGEAIVFDSDGNLLDGQHRLWAAFEYRHTFESVVVRGVAPGAFKTLDSGMKRSAGDVLTKAGFSPYATLTAAAIRLVHFYECGAKDHAIITRLSSAETLDLMSKYPRIVEAVGMVGPRDALKRIIPLTSFAAFMYFAIEGDGEKAEQFLDAFVTGADLRRGDPRLTSRNYFINLRQRNVRLPARIQLAILIKAWNALIEESDIGVMKFADGEKYPQFAHRMKKKPALKRVA